MAFETLALAKLFLDFLKFLEGKFNDKDRTEFTKLVRALSDFRLLTSPNEAEYAGAVIASAQKLRNLIAATAQSLPEDSHIETGVLTLGQIVRQFISEVEGIEASIRSQLDLIVANIDVGVQPDESRARFLAHWKRNGYPAHVLRDNHNLNVMRIEYEGYRIQFLLALGALRGQFGVFLSLLCEATHTVLPEQLASLTPGIERLEESQESSA